MFLAGFWLREGLSLAFPVVVHSEFMRREPRYRRCGSTRYCCCIRVRKPDPALPPLPGSDWCYRLTCTDGPIFSAAQLLW